MEHDLAVIGSGPGGYIASIRAAQLGLNVACIEREATLGGTCLRIGCIPSKALLESTERLCQARDQGSEHGIKISDVAFDLSAMLRRKDHVVASLTRGVEALFRKNKITRYLGHGAIDGPGRVRVTPFPEGNTLVIKARNIIIATGSTPLALTGVAWDGEFIGTSTEALSYSQVPRHLIVIGAGYIGLELGSVWNRLGAKVTILEYLDRILYGMDAQLAAEAKQVLHRQGLEFHFGARVNQVWRDGGECVVETEGREPIRGDRVLVAVGRMPNTQDLGLDSVAIRLHEKGSIPVNERYATSAEGIYAIGDVIAGPMLAHKAEEEAVACVEGIVKGHAHVNYEAIPGVVFTAPQIAAVGRTEEQLRETGVAYRRGIFPFKANGRARALGHTEGMIKVLADERTDRILGVHALGPHAGDLINEAAVAMAFGGSSEDLGRACHAHPTLGEALREASLGVTGAQLNL